MKKLIKVAADFEEKLKEYPEDAEKESEKPELISLLKKHEDLFIDETYGYPMLLRRAEQIFSNKLSSLQRTIVPRSSRSGISSTVNREEELENYLKETYRTKSVQNIFVEAVFHEWSPGSDLESIKGDLKFLIKVGYRTILWAAISEQKKTIRGIEAEQDSIKTFLQAVMEKENEAYKDVIDSRMSKYEYLSSILNHNIGYLERLNMLKKNHDEFVSEVESFLE